MLFFSSLSFFLVVVLCLASAVWSVGPYAWSYGIVSPLMSLFYLGVPSIHCITVMGGSRDLTTTNIATSQVFQRTVQGGAWTSATLSIKRAAGVGLIYQDTATTLRQIYIGGYNGTNYVGQIVQSNGGNERNGILMTDEHAVDHSNSPSVPSRCFCCR